MNARISRHSKLLISLVFVVFIASCSTSPTGRPQLILKSDAELEAQARSTFNAYKATLPLTTDRAKIDFVHCVAQAVVGELDPPYSDIEWELAIFEQNQINAFAMPRMGPTDGRVRRVWLRLQTVLVARRH